MILVTDETLVTAPEPSYVVTLEGLDSLGCDASNDS